MTTDAVLTDEQVVGMSRQFDSQADFARAIEQAVLQSPEVQRLRNVAKALIMFQADYEQCAGQSMPGNEHWSERLMQIVDMADAAMEKQP